MTKTDDSGLEELRTLYENVQHCGLKAFRALMATYSVGFLMGERVSNTADGWRACLLGIRGMLEKGHDIELALDTAERFITTWELRGGVAVDFDDSLTMPVSSKPATD